MKEERRAVMCVSNFRVIEGLDYSAESASKRRKPITWWGRRTQGEARLPEVWCSQHWKRAWDRAPRSFRQKDPSLPLRWAWVRLRTWNRPGFVGIFSFPYAIDYCQAALCSLNLSLQSGYYKGSLPVSSIVCKPRKRGWGCCQEMRASPNTGTWAFREKVYSKQG